MERDCTIFIFHRLCLPKQLHAAHNKFRESYANQGLQVCGLPSILETKDRTIPYDRLQLHHSTVLPNYHSWSSYHLTWGYITSVGETILKINVHMPETTGYCFRLTRVHTHTHGYTHSTDMWTSTGHLCTLHGGHNHKANCLYLKTVLYQGWWTVQHSSACKLYSYTNWTILYHTQSNHNM